MLNYNWSVIWCCLKYFGTFVAPQKTLQATLISFFIRHLVWILKFYISSLAKICENSHLGAYARPLTSDLTPAFRSLSFVFFCFFLNAGTFTSVKKQERLTLRTKRIWRTLLSNQATFTVVVPSDTQVCFQSHDQPRQVWQARVKENNNPTRTAPLCVSHLVWVEKTMGAL